jgi:uncharacterized protein YciI
MSDTIAHKEPVAETVIEMSRRRGYLAKPPSVMLTKPCGGMDSIAASLPSHLEYWVDLEHKGVMFVGGPSLPTGRSEDPAGGGLIIYRASSLEHAIEIAENDPMHRSGARRFTLKPWRLNHLNAQDLRDEG